MNLDFSEASQAVPESKAANAPAPISEKIPPKKLEQPKVAAEPQIFSVSQINMAIRAQVEGSFPMVWIKGEISNFKTQPSGHCYFSLKDDKSQINAVMFKGFCAHLKFKPESGLEVLVRGRITVYPPRGQYQIFCEVMEPVGLGALQLQFEQLKKKLESEGLLDPTKKRPLPTLPERIAIVTSPTGAAIRDMLNVLGRRYRAVSIDVFPCAVQGQNAAREIVAAIELANKVGNYDVMIVGRGGGSVEDLWSFNEEIVARAISKSRIPVVSAVGHEVDFTIADFVADLRAPTPSAAAELVVRNASDMQNWLSKNLSFLKSAISKKIQKEILSVRSLSRLLIDPKKKLQDYAQACDSLFQQLQDGIVSKIKNDRNTVVHLAELLDTLSPLKVMDRGYSIVKTENKVVKSIKSLSTGQTIEVHFQDGVSLAEVEKVWKR